MRLCGDVTALGEVFLSLLSCSRLEIAIPQGQMAAAGSLQTLTHPRTAPEEDEQ